jgi:fructuronate reductase
VSVGCARRLSRVAGDGRAAAPVRILHLGLGSFFRAHQCWYSEHAPDAEQWGIAAFTGRSSSALVRELDAQRGLYTVLTRDTGEDRFERVSSLSRAHAASAHDAWLSYFRQQRLAVVTVTVTEAGYLASAGGGLEIGHHALQADLEALRRDRCAPVRTAAARLLAGLAARREADGGPLALVPCDNLADNGLLAGRIVRELAELLDAPLATWIAESLSVVSTVVDRITPATTAQDVQIVLRSTGRDDRCPVVTEPFSEWVLSGSFPAGRPRWEDAGAIVTDDLRPFEQRKLWLLNGGHSLLAYAGSIAGHETVADAILDETCRFWLAQWWDAVAPHLQQPAGEIADYKASLLQRWANPRIAHRLAQIAADGSQKLPIRILPVLRAERCAGRLPAGATRVLAAWICHLRGNGAPVSDPCAAEYVELAAGPRDEAVKRVLGKLDPDLGDDTEVISITAAQCRELAPVSGR